MAAAPVFASAPIVAVAPTFLVSTFPTLFPTLFPAFITPHLRPHLAPLVGLETALATVRVHVFAIPAVLHEVHRQATGVVLAAKARQCARWPGGTHM